MVVSTLLLAGGLLVWAPVLEAPPLWTGAFWAIPFVLLAWALPAGHGSRNVLFGWLAVGWIAASAALPHLWLLHWQARLEQADAELTRLGTQPDPRLDNLLRDFAERALFFASEGEGGVDLLYRSWVASDLATEGYEARIALWNGATREAELGLSEVDFPPAMVPTMLAAARAAEEPLVERFTDHRAVHYLLSMSLPGGRVVSVAVPPRRRLGRATALARFIDPAGPGDQGELTSLSLVPVPPEGSAASPRWIRTSGGWRSEVRVPFPEGPMHAHLLIRTPPPPILATRTLLLAALQLGILALLWVAGRAFAGLSSHGVAERGWIHTFRGRLTLALFGFFLLPTLVFSATAYRALSREVVRTAEALASRSLEQAVDEGPEVPVATLGEHVRADLLLYRRGVLAEAASPEVIDLGLYPTWLPRNMFLAFRSGETLDTVEQRRLGGQPYLLAYHQRGPNAVLAAPVPLVSGDTARRQRDLADVVLLAALLGAALSFALSLLVGRALSAPIDRLSLAAAAVGAGDLEVRLPEERPDEFGGLYRSFNRMVQRLRRARSAEVRTARVLAWGEMARQVAHEIKNPLTPIKLSVQHLRRAYRDGRPDYGDILDRNVEGVLREIDQLSEIARAFARFGTPAEAAGPLEPVDLAPVLADTLALYRGGEDGIRYRLELPADTPSVQARTGELKEVLINLLENSRAALDGSGEIAIRATRMEPDWMHLEVSDTGTGIPPDALPHIFEPQFSTRTSGTGLGLAIVRRLVEGWGGEIHAESEPGVGTMMRLRLRVAPTPEQA
ncbi:MAG: HAMP domain-containing protein [Gemmatimonadetes bacterium]|nr:HAMP domain-containing protein [Gemmatimonadota bacterium]